MNTKQRQFIVDCRKALRNTKVEADAAGTGLPAATLSLVDDRLQFSNFFYIPPDLDERALTVAEAMTLAVMSEETNLVIFSSDAYWMKGGPEVTRGDHPLAEDPRAREALFSLSFVRDEDTGEWVCHGFMDSYHYESEAGLVWDREDMLDEVEGAVASFSGQFVKAFHGSTKAASRIRGSGVTDAEALAMVLHERDKMSSHTVLVLDEDLRARVQEVLYS